MDRRQWLRRVVSGVADTAAHVVEEKLEQRFPTQLRPPGAASEAEFLASCTRCGDCIKACPYGAVFRFTDEAGPMLANTPVMAPDQRPCHLCDDYPCIAACEPGALKMPEELPAWGTVRVDESRCFTFQGPECGACAGLCPRGVVAIRMVRCRPQVDEKACIGCGLCVHACVMTPSAIALQPAP